MMSDFYGLPTRVISNKYIKLEFLSEAGPRLVRLFLDGLDKNLLAELPNQSEKTPYGSFRFHGGHRLWHAPESYPRTYIPDDQGLTFKITSHGVYLEGAIEAATGVRKSMEIVLNPERAELKVIHTIANQGVWPIELAVWAITQLPLGGVAILPQQVGPLDPSGLLPNRQLVLWTYSRWSDPRLSLADDFLLVSAEPSLPPLKIGYANRPGWVGYLNNGILLVKRLPDYTDQPYVDYGSNCECYCNDQFIELESLSALRRLEPDQSISHEEVWRVFPIEVTPTDREAMIQMVEKLVLG